jgi:hypothetical protein
VARLAQGTDKAAQDVRNLPRRACNGPGTFHVQINSTLERIVPVKPGGASRPRPTHYFHVHAVQDGYVMVSAPTEPDLACTGGESDAGKGRLAK